MPNIVSIYTCAVVNAILCDELNTIIYKQSESYGIMEKNRNEDDAHTHTGIC